MVVAYLRGQLREDYPEGFRSKMREEVILAALNEELRHDRIKNVAMVRAAFLPIAAKAGELQQDILKDLWESHDRKAGIRERMPDLTMNKDRESAIELYKEMALRGDFGPFVAEELGLTV